MGESITWTKASSIEIKGDDATAWFNQGCEFIASRFGLSLYETVSDLERKYAFGATGLGVLITGSEMMGAVSFGGSLLYKDTSGVYQSAGGFVNLFSDVRAIKDSNFICERANMNGVLINRIRDENHGAKGYFSSIRVTDYFSSQTRSCILNGSYVYSYDPVDCLAENFIKIPIGNENYPSKRILAVAAPVILKSDTFYGYVENSTLYHIRSSIPEITIGGYYEKTVLDGRQFVHIGDGYHFL